MAKYNLGGAVIGESRTSSVILFGKEQQSEAGAKKREVKAMSSKRSVTGKFEGGTKFGGSLFIKKG